MIIISADQSVALCQIDSTRSHPGINQLDNHGKKHGYWKVYLNESFKESTPGARYCYYNYFDHDYDVAGFFNPPHERLIRLAEYSPKTLGDTLLDGTLIITSINKKYMYEVIFKDGLTVFTKETAFIDDSFGYVIAKSSFRTSSLSEYPVLDYWQWQDDKGDWRTHYYLGRDAKGDAVNLSLSAADDVVPNVIIHNEIMFAGNNNIELIAKEDSLHFFLHRGEKGEFKTSSSRITLGQVSKKKIFSRDRTIVDIQEFDIPYNNVVLHIYVRNIDGKYVYETKRVGID